MKKELVALVKELFAMDGLHEEYQDNDTQFVIDSQKNGNTVTITVTLEENKDKKNFEDWLDQIDDDLFSEITDNLPEGSLYNINELYKKGNYKVAKEVLKKKAEEILNSKINQLKNLIG